MVVAVVAAIALVVAGALVAEADTVQELVAAVVELVELVADATVLVFVRVVAAGLAAKTDRVDSNVYRANTIQHLLAVKNGVARLELKQKVQDLSLPARRSAYSHKHDRPWR